MISVYDSLPGMRQIEDTHSVNQTNSIMVTDRPAYTASVTVFKLYRTFHILPVIADCTEVTPLHTFPAAVTR